MPPVIMMGDFTGVAASRELLSDTCTVKEEPGTQVGATSGRGGMARECGEELNPVRGWGCGKKCPHPPSLSPELTVAFAW